MLLPASDLGLITSHLSAHDGTMMKIKLYAKQTDNSKLQKLLNTQLGTMRSHVRIMMEMIDPEKSDFSSVPSLEELPKDQVDEGSKGSVNMDKHIALELKTMTESMAKDNFFSALKMKDTNVKKAHVDMALQQVDMLKDITEFLKEKEADSTPLGTSDEQKKVLNHFSHIMEE